ncbi:hypothetical protein N44_02690 [Microcystis aeruginosa NIES-44]|uniref:Uncharacterized protein n=1 Tax=Microcystis aeruginosa NIES-44 TaxID=449439 RepID=A0A0A1VWJ7_MICAE|nr:hypothetical protein N44_02690 [Microcystis aeruginosa NIES-44]
MNWGGGEVGKLNQNPNTPTPQHLKPVSYLLNTVSRLGEY